MNKKVYIILLNYNGFKDTIECVESIEKNDYPNYEIIIVDNLSQDDSYNKLKEAIGNKHIVISSGKNGGFAFGNNIGIKYAMDNCADYVLLLNNDTTVEENFLSELVNCAEKDESIGLATGLILNYYNKDIIWYDGGEINWNKFYGYHINEGKSIKDIDVSAKEISFATGCLMLIKKEVINNIGGLPEEYFMYYEDVDYCAAIKENGYKIYYNPKSIIYHKISAASGESESPFAVEWNTRNRLKFIEKYKNKVSKSKYLSLQAFFYSTRLIKGAEYIVKGRSDKAKALLKGLR